MGKRARCSWLTPVILTTQEAEIRRIMVGSQSRKIVWETQHKNGLGYGSSGRVPALCEFKSQYHQKKKKSKRLE
jgi:hypothetical protein